MVTHTCTFTRTHTESDEHGTPPPRRQRAASIPRNAEELACHVLHGSLRLTPSRQQILSHSGIRLEERAASQQEAGGQQQQTNTQVFKCKSSDVIGLVSIVHTKQQIWNFRKKKTNFLLPILQGLFQGVLLPPPLVNWLSLYLIWDYPLLLDLYLPTLEVCHYALTPS